MLWYGGWRKINSSSENLVCAYDECNQEFVKATHNQKYCSDECCRLATNKRTMQRYYERRAIKLGSLRHCEICKTRLSRYNYTSVCVSCEKSDKEKQRKDILDMLNGTI